MFTKNRNNAIEIELISKNKLNNYIKKTQIKEDGSNKIHLQLIRVSWS